MLSFRSKCLNSTMVQFKFWIPTTERTVKEMRLNSTMVQFKCQKISTFNFVKWRVSIPLWFNSNTCPSQIFPLLFLCLNSTMVQFKFYYERSRIKKKTVSIPLWFNSNKDKTGEWRSKFLVSIPLWFNSNKTLWE